MPTKTGKTYASFYGNDLQVSRTSNAGIDTTTRSIEDGLGDATAISLSDDVLQVQPQSDDTTGAFLVKNQGGSNILAVDSDNSRVLCGSGQVNALTQYKEFSCVNLAPLAGYHMIIASKGDVFHNTDALDEINLGYGDNPATTLDVSAHLDTVNIVPLYWYLPDAITVVAVHVLAGGSTASTAADLNFQLYSYAMDTSSNHGDLSDGTLVAGTVGATGSFITDIHEDLIKYQSLANCPTDVAAGRVILATVESTGSNVISVNMVVKYHIQ
jgi:hypothetical protein